MQIEFTIPAPPSLKNNVRIGRGRMRKAGNVRAAMRLIRQVASRAAIAAETDTVLDVPTFGDDDIGVEMIHHAKSGELTVRVWSEGPRPRRFTGRKRDLQNLQDGVLDALQGVLFANDNQVVSLTMQRRLD